MNPSEALLVVAHDAGGAEMVSAWLKKRGGSHRVDLLVEGPATKIIQKKLDPNTFRIVDRSILESLAQYHWVLTGSSWASDLEKKAHRACKRAGVRVVTFLDHWVNYAIRFELEGTTILPDEIWVGDLHAKRMASQVFPNLPITLIENPYFEEIRTELTKIQSTQAADKTRGTGIRVLFASEPTSEHAAQMTGNPNHFGYTEFTALTEYLDYLQLQNTVIERFRFRPHPSEKVGKYTELLSRYADKFHIEQSTSTTILEDCAWADWVVGCETVAMVIGLLAEKRVFSCTPKAGPPLTLPFPEIVRLFKAESPVKA